MGMQIECESMDAIQCRCTKVDDSQGSSRPDPGGKGAEYVGVSLVYKP